ncbi:MAG: hypothetical protein M1827_007112, partial [Pycnora praestabilis]
MSAKEFRRLMDEYRIYFSSPSIGQIQFGQYCGRADDHSLEKPWKTQTIHRAERITKIVSRCLKEERNEAGWRFAIEPEVFLRFSFEAACPNCRARIWRSEIEATVADGNPTAPLLQDRRNSREPCRCSLGSRPQDRSEIGLNPLFSNRAQQVILHDPQLKSLRKQEPDRVYGPRQTKNFESALNAQEGGDPENDAPRKRVREAIRSSPFLEIGEPLLFPFLILEVKSEKGPDGLRSIEKQTAFPIWTLLKIQEEQVFEIWSEDLRYKNGALQLLLIVDYVFDWARDIYGPAILHKLQLLSTMQGRSSFSLSEDDDIYSMKRPFDNSDPRSQSESDWDTPTPEVYAPGSALYEETSLIRQLDSLHGVVRHASIIENRHLGLYLTGDNAKTLLQSFGSEAAARSLTQDIISLKLKDPILVTGEALNRVENVWTGRLRRNADPRLLQSKFYTKIAFVTYLTSLWDQVRELPHLAICEDALDVLTRYVEMKKISQLAKETVTVVETTIFRKKPSW